MILNDKFTTCFLMDFVTLNPYIMHAEGHTVNRSIVSSIQKNTILYKVQT